MLLARADVCGGARHVASAVADRDRRCRRLICLPAPTPSPAWNFPGGNLFSLSFLAVNAFPRFALYVAIAVVFLPLGLIGTFTGVVLIQLICTLLFMIWIPVAAFQGVDRAWRRPPATSAPASASSVRITLPQAAPAIAAALLLTFVDTFYETEGALLDRRARISAPCRS